MKVRYIIMGLCALTLCSCHNGHNHSHGHDHSAHSHDEPAMSESHSESLHAGEVHFSHEQAEAIGLETEKLQKAPSSIRAESCLARWAQKLLSLHRVMV